MNSYRQAILLMLLLLSSRMMGQSINTPNEMTTVVDSTQTGYRCYHPGYIVPSFPGGTECLMTWLSENVIYPAKAEQDSIQGKVVVSFMVKPDGTPCNPEIVSSPHPILSQEALRIISIMPKWNPGNNLYKDIWQNEKFQIPLTFRLGPQTPIDSTCVDMQPTRSRVVGHRFDLGQSITGWGYILTPNNDLINKIDVIYLGIVYTLGLSDNQTIEYISTTDKRFRINGYKVGDEITKTHTIRGWGNYVKINEEWYAAWMPKTFDEEEKKGKIQWFFRFKF